MFTVHVALDVKPERVDEFLDAIHTNASASVREEVGCEHFDVIRDAEVPTRFYFYEIYRDRHAFEVVHRGAAHYADWLAAEERCLIEGSKVVTFGELLLPRLVLEAP